MIILNSNINNNNNNDNNNSQLLKNTLSTAFFCFKNEGKNNNYLYVQQLSSEKKTEIN